MNTNLIHALLVSLYPTPKQEEWFITVLTVIIRWNVIWHQSIKHKLQNKEVVEHPIPMRSEEYIQSLYIYNLWIGSLLKIPLNLLKYINFYKEWKINDAYNNMNLFYLHKVIHLITILIHKDTCSNNKTKL